MKIYNEIYKGTARTVEELMNMLRQVPDTFTVSVYAVEHTSDVEVWIDEEIKSVILK